MGTFYAQYPASTSGINPSIGTNGAAIPTSSTLVAGEDPSLNLKPLQVDASGNLLVSLAAEPGAPIHVIVDSSALPSGAATLAEQALQLTQETNIATSTASLDSKTVHVDTGAVVITSSALPSGAATLAEQALQLTQETNTATSVASIDTKTLTAGQKTMAASYPVVLASDQSSIPVAATLQASSAVIGHVIVDSGTLTAVTAITNALPAGSNVIGHVISDTGSTTAVTQATGSNLHMVVDSGTITAVTAITNALPAGSNIIGNVRVDQTTPGTTNGVAIAQVGANTVLTGNGVTGTGSLRVTLASDTSTNTNPFSTNQKGLATANAPITNDYSSVNVTTAAYTQLIASTTSATTYVDIFDSSGQAMILATGGAGSETVQAYIPPGGDSFSFAIPASTRVAIKALTATATSGYILLNLRS